MGIINVTDDSFSGDGLLIQRGADRTQEALKQVKIFIEQGADIIDIGGESTRPGAHQIELDDEVNRVIPIIQEIHSLFPNVPISIDTYKSGVAEQAILAGACMINDVWACRVDPNIAKVAAKYDVPLILMHNRSTPSSVEIQAKLGGRYTSVEYDDLIQEVKEGLRVSVDLALLAGVPERNIIIDPGIGFGKTIEQNLTLVNRLDEMKSLGFPILLGTSRKSFIGYTLNLPPEERIEGTAATVAVGILRGADIIRVHDVKEMVRVARMTDAIVRI